MRLSFCLLSVLFASTLTAHGTTATFDIGSLPPDATPPFVLTSGGLTATINIATSSYEFGGTPVSSEHFLYVEDFVPVNFAFSSDISSLALDFATFSPEQTVDFELFRGGALVGSASGVTGLDSVGPSYGSIDLTGDFNSVVMSADDYTGVGSFTATTATPEPSSLLLLGTGLLGTVGALRHRLTNRSMA